MTFATTLFRVAAPCLLAGAAHASPVAVPVPVPAADGGHPVPATVYSPALPYRAAAAEAASPDRAWREQHRIVGAYNSMMLTMDGHGADAHAADAKAAPASGASCCKDGCCCKGAAAGSGGCCAKGGDDAPPSCAPALPAAPAPHHHGGQP